MNSNRKRFALLVGLLIAIVALTAAATPLLAGSRAQELGELSQYEIKKGVLQFDIAEDMTTFVADEAPVHEDGMPAGGNPFIIHGYIYPGGTLGESDGVLADGSPEYPDKVIGEWICRGWIIGEGMHATTGALAITTQIFSLDGELGEVTLVTDGFESLEANAPFTRAITGGTGEFSKVRGEQTQEVLGFNTSGALNLRVELKVQ